MSRIPRICLVFVLSFVLLAATVPAAHARTLAKPQSSNSMIGSLIDVTLHWITSFGTGTSQAAPAPQKPGMKTGSVPVGGSGGSGFGGVRTMCGSTVDPWGNCVGGTGG
jgi:hypothetical protein